MFDPSKLTEIDEQILEAFYERRKLFDTYIKDKCLNLFTCPGCGYPTLSERGNYEICRVCSWEDDYQDDKEADKVWGGPNKNLSLTENRINIGRILLDKANSVKANINLDPSFVLSTLEFYAKKKKAVENRMTEQGPFDHPNWQEWEQVQRDLLISLCTSNP